MCPDGHRPLHSAPQHAHRRWPEKTFWDVNEEEKELRREVPAGSALRHRPSDGGLPTSQRWRSSQSNTAKPVLPAWERAQRVTTLPERDLSVILVVWQGTSDDGPPPLILTACAVRLSRTNRPASMPLVRVVDRSRCKLPRACGSSGGSRRIGGMSAAQTHLPPPSCLGAMTRPGPLSWPGWANPAIRSWTHVSVATTGDGGAKLPPVMPSSVR
jgi:hypothetical protein